MAHIYLDGVLNALRETNAAFSIETQPGVSPQEVLVLPESGYVANVMGRAIYPTGIGKPKIHWYLESEREALDKFDLATYVTPRDVIEKKAGQYISYHTQMPWGTVLKILIHGINSGDNSIIGDNIEIAEGVMDAMDVLSVSERTSRIYELEKMSDFLKFADGDDSIDSENLMYLNPIRSNNTHGALLLQPLSGGGLYQLVSLKTNAPLLLAMVADYDVEHKNMILGIFLDGTQ